MENTVMDKAKSLFPLLDDSMEHLGDASGFKLEMTNGIPTWEAFPVYRHQKKTLDIQLSLIENAKKPRPKEGGGCECVHVADLTIQFPDGSVKRPDISIFCHEPLEQETACKEIPEAVIEIISKGYEKKDTEISLPFYLSYNIPDVVLFDPETNKVSHYHNGQKDEYDSPVDLTFHCGCHVTV